MWPRSFEVHGAWVSRQLVREGRGRRFRWTLSTVRPVLLMWPTCGAVAGWDLGSFSSAGSSSGRFFGFVEPAFSSCLGSCLLLYNETRVFSGAVCQSIGGAIGQKSPGTPRTARGNEPARVSDWYGGGLPCWDLHACWSAIRRRGE